MTVKFVTHEFKTDDVTVMGTVTDAAHLRGHKVSRIGAIEGQEVKNPAQIHVSFEVTNHPDQIVSLVLGVQDAVELGLLLIGVGIESQPGGVKQICDRLTELTDELNKTLQVSR